MSHQVDSQVGLQFVSYLGLLPIGSMVLLYIYMVTWIPSIYPLYVSIYSSTMDPSWVVLQTSKTAQRLVASWGLGWPCFLGTYHADVKGTRAKLSCHYHYHESLIYEQNQLYPLINHYQYLKNVGEKVDIVDT